MDKHEHYDHPEDQFEYYEDIPISVPPMEIPMETLKWASGNIETIKAELGFVFSLRTYHPGSAVLYWSSVGPEVVGPVTMHREVMVLGCKHQDEEGFHSAFFVNGRQHIIGEGSGTFFSSSTQAARAAIAEMHAFAKGVMEELNAELDAEAKRTYLAK